MADEAVQQSTINPLPPVYPALSATSDLPVPTAAPDPAPGDGGQPRRERPSKTEREVAELSATVARLAETVQARAAAPPPAVVAPLKRPRRADFDDPDAYDDAVYEHASATAAAKQAAAAADENVRRSQEAADRRLASEWNEKRTAALDRYDDYAEVAESPDTPMTIAMLHAIVNSEAGPDIAYWLGQNQKEAARISKIDNPIRQALEIGKIEAAVAAGQKPATSPASPTARSSTRATWPTASARATQPTAEADSTARIERHLAELRKGTVALGWGVT